MVVVVVEGGGGGGAVPGLVVVVVGATGGGTAWSSAEASTSVDRPSMVRYGANTMHPPASEV